MTKPTPNPTLLSDFTGGITLLAVGPAGTGKSDLCGTICEIVPPEEVRLICPKPNERNSYRYVRSGLDRTAQIFRDPLWLPSLGKYEADGYLRLMRYLLSLYEDTEASVVILDPLTDAVQLAAHDLLKAENAATPRDLRDSIGFYGALKYKLKDMVQALVGLASPELPKPKHVLVTIHAQPTKDEDIKGKETAEHKAKGIEFFGDVLPMMEGGYRRELASEFDIVGYTSVRHQNVRDGAKLVQKAVYEVQLTPDNERHAKVRLGPALATKRLPNHLPTILQAIKEAREAA